MSSDDRTEVMQLKAMKLFQVGSKGSWDTLALISSGKFIAPGVWADQERQDSLDPEKVRANRDLWQKLSRDFYSFSKTFGARDAHLIMKRWLDLSKSCRDPQRGSIRGYRVFRPTEKEYEGAKRAHRDFRTAASKKNPTMSSNLFLAGKTGEEWTLCPEKDHKGDRVTKVRPVKITKSSAWSFSEPESVRDPWYTVVWKVCPACRGAKKNPAPVAGAVVAAVAQALLPVVMKAGGKQIAAYKRADMDGKIKMLKKWALYSLNFQFRLLLQHKPTARRIARDLDKLLKNKKALKQIETVGRVGVEAGKAYKGAKAKKNTKKKSTKKGRWTPPLPVTGGHMEEWAERLPGLRFFAVGETAGRVIEAMLDKQPDLPYFYAGTTLSGESTATSPGNSATRFFAQWRKEYFDELFDEAYKAAGGRDRRVVKGQVRKEVWFYLKRAGDAAIKHSPRYEPRLRGKAKKNGPTRDKPHYPFAEKERQYARYTVAQLHHAMNDAMAASRAQQGWNPAGANWYLDDYHTIVKEIQKRKRAKKNSGQGGGFERIGSRTAAKKEMSKEDRIRHLKGIAKAMQDYLGYGPSQVSDSLTKASLRSVEKEIKALESGNSPKRKRAKKNPTKAASRRAKSRRGKEKFVKLDVGHPDWSRGWTEEIEVKATSVAEAKKKARAHGYIVRYAEDYGMMMRHIDKLEKERERKRAKIKKLIAAGFTVEEALARVGL